MQKRYKINLHAHTTYSDGHHSLKRMALRARHLGMCAFVVTDHYYSMRDLHHYSMTPGKFLKQIEEAKKISKEINFPIIVGIESTFACGSEEVNIFGREAILNIMNNGTGIEDFQYIRDNFHCAISLNHPRLCGSIEGGMCSVIDCYERFNHGCDFFKGEHGDPDRRVIPDIMRTIPQYSNADAHCVDELERGWNIIDTKITNEYDLINFIRNNSPVGLYAQYANL